MAGDGEGVISKTIHNIEWERAKMMTNESWLIGTGLQEPPSGYD